MLRTLGIAVVMMGTASTTHAASIGVNFGDATPSWDAAPGASQSAGLMPQINWMNVGTASASSLTLTDNTGAATTAALTFSGNLLPVIQIATLVDETNADEMLNNSYVASFSAPFTFTVTGVPYATYDVIAYINSALTGRTHSATVGATTYYGLSPDAIGAGYVDGNTGTPYTYTQAVSTSSGTPTPNGNYFLFPGVTGTTLTLTMNTPNDVAQLTALQIVDAVPEPASAGLLLGGLCVLGLRRFRRAKPKA